jgi:hypothetical protein
MTNLETLIKAMGYQGGTVHQVARDLGVVADDILNANTRQMRDLLKIARARIEHGDGFATFHNRRGFFGVWCNVNIGPHKNRERALEDIKRFARNVMDLEAANDQQH